LDEDGALFKRVKERKEDNEEEVHLVTTRKKGEEKRSRL